jgi:F420-dependent oxidoreductase-like protein
MQVDFSAGIEAAAERVALLENAGLDIAWVSEAYGFDAVSALGFLAARTRRVQLGSGVLPIFSRVPTLLAQTAAGLDFVSGGRAILGLGASGPQVVEGWFGLPYDQPLQRTREIIEICRRVWRREIVTHDGPVYPLPLPPAAGTGLGKPIRMLAAPPRERVPIYLAALGPKNVELAAQMADGWLPILYVPERAAGVWGAALAAGLSHRSADLGPLEIVAGGPVAIGEGLESLREETRRGVARLVGGMGARNRNFYADLVRRYGWTAEAARIQDLYLSGQRQEAAVAVPADLLEHTSLIGSAQYVKQRMRAYYDSGVSVLDVVIVHGDPVATMRQLRQWADDLAPTPFQRPSKGPT